LLLPTHRQKAPVNMANELRQSIKYKMTQMTQRWEYFITNLWLRWQREESWSVDGVKMGVTYTEMIHYDKDGIDMSYN